VGPIYPTQPNLTQPVDNSAEACFKRFWRLPARKRDGVPQLSVPARGERRIDGQWKWWIGNLASV